LYFVNTSAFKADHDGNLYLFASQSLSTNILWKLDTNGNPLWSKPIATTAVNNWRDLRIDNSNRVFIAIDFAAQPIKNQQYDEHHGIMFNKYNPDGSTVYEKHLVGYDINDQIGLFDASLDNNGNITMAGYFNGSVKLLNAPGDPIHPWNDFHNSFFLAHFPDAP
jgi:hypothetical protein